MPWRKRWIDPNDFEGKEEDLGNVLAKRAYEVWVSEVSEYALFVFGAVCKSWDASTRCHVLYH